MRRTKPGFAFGRERSLGYLHREALVEPDATVYRRLFGDNS
jgi:hypothetical protein